jgi:hypothetical protein
MNPLAPWLAGVWLAAAPAADPGPAAGSPCPPLDADPGVFASPLPVILLDTGGQRLTADRKPPVGIGVVERPGEDFDADAAAARLLPGRARLLGHSSVRFPKKQVLLQLDAEAPVLGLPAARRFVLEAPYTDRSLLREVLAYRWARQAGMPAARTRPVELYLDDTGGPVRRVHYHGVYVLTEWIGLPGAGPGGDPAGGFLFRRDRPEAGDAVFSTDRGERYIVDVPEPITPEQLAALRLSVNRAEGALFDPGSPLEDRIDLGSFVDHVLLDEVSRNPDGFATSTFFSLSPGGRLYSGPPLDYDVAFGDHDGAAAPTGWQLRATRPGRSPYPAALFARPEFRRAFAARYRCWRAGWLADGAVAADIEAAARALGPAIDRNFARWPVLGRPTAYSSAAPATHAAELDRLRRWLLERLRWLDKELAAETFR